MQKSKKRRLGFTIIEILIAISIIALIATLATGAALKSIKQARARRIEASRSVLQLGIANYHALHGEWPCKFDTPDAGNRTFQTIKGTQNARVFKEIFLESKNNRALIDTSVIFTRVAQGRMTVKQALEKGASDIPVGYPDAQNPDKFRYFQIQYNFITDDVNVLLE